MTIIVYDPATDRILVDSLHQISGGFKTVDWVHSKVHVSPDGHKYTISGSGDEFMTGMMIDAVFKKMIDGEAPLIDVNPDEANLFVRHKDGQAYIPDKQGTKTMLTKYILPFPISRAAGGYFFDAYYVEHGSVDIAMALTCQHALGSGFPIESF